MKSRLRLFDTHLHLQDQRLDRCREASTEPEPPGDIITQLTNGTHPSDWPDVADLTGEHILKAYGVHPWKVSDLPEDWESILRGFLESEAVSVGEIGLDRWIEPRNEDLQIEIFEKQLLMANEYELAPSIHCIRAWGMLVDCLRRATLPKGFLVHGFGGSKEVLYQLLDLGGYVSFSAYAAHPGRHRMREAIRACPADRLLAETDAPGMAPPENVCLYPLSDTKGRIHHPLEIQTAYNYLAKWRGIEVPELAIQVETNFKRLFAKISRRDISH